MQRALLCLTLIASPALGQELTKIEQAADTILESVIPAKDDPFGTLMRVLDVAETVRSTEIASFMVSVADGLLNSSGDPRKVLSRVDRFAKDGISGETAHELDIVRTRIYRILGRSDDVAASRAFDGYASSLTAFGPFGDDGDDYTGVEFPLDRGIPTETRTWQGRFGRIGARRTNRHWNLYRIHFRDARHNRSGCHYLLHQVIAEADTSCYLRAFVDGSFTVFVNGEKIAVIDSALQDQRSPFRIPATLRQGHNHIVVKTCENRTHRIGLRLTDVRGFPLGGVQEFAGAPEVRPHAKKQSSAKRPPKWRFAADLLEAAAKNRAGDARARLLLAAAVATRSSRDSYRLVDTVLQKPPVAPRLRLALSQILRRVNYLPAAWRRDRARALVEDIGDALGDHFALFLQRCRHLEDEDKREDAVRALRQRIQTGEAGPGTHGRLSALYRSLGFWAEFRRHEAEWMQAVPRDLRPVMSSIAFRTQSGDYAGALRLAKTAVEQLPGHQPALTQLYGRASDTGDAALARKALAALYPRASARSVNSLRALAQLERKLGREKEYLDLQEKIAAHPSASLATVRGAADILFANDRAEAALALMQRVLAEEPSNVALRRRLWRLAGSPEFSNMTRFRVDTTKILQGFAPTARERGASSTLLLDHMIVEVFPDGSSVQEVHTLRRINDLQGVQQFEGMADAANADEVLLLRTIGTDGKSYVPNRVNDSFSMPRVEPGAFIEARYRSFEPSPLPSPRRITTFYFQSTSTPYLRSEVVMILPENHRSKIRPRNFPNKPTVETLADGKIAYTYRVDDVPRLPTEAALPPTEDTIPILACGEDGSHNATAREYRSGAHGAVFVTPPIRRKAEELIRGKKTDLEKAQAIHEFVHREIADARASSFPTTVLLDKKGPRYWLELALLSAADIPYRHGLCAAARKDRRPEAEPFYKGETPYTVSCARIEPRGGKPFWLFYGLPRRYPLGKIPAQRYGAERLLFDPIQTGTLPPGEVREGLGFLADAQLSLEPSGDAVMQLELRLRGEVGFGIAESMRNTTRDRQQRFARGFLGGMMQGWTLGRQIEFVKLDSNDPLTLRCTMRKRRALEPAGTDFLLPLPMRPSQLLASWGGRAGRKLPMRLHDEFAMRWRVTVDPGEGFEIVELPKSASAKEMLVDYSLRYETKDGKSSIVRDFMQRAGSLAPQQFDTWRSLLKKLDDAEGVNMKLRRKQGP